MLAVRDAPALPNELRAAMVTWLPVMSAGVAVDILCAISLHVNLDFLILGTDASILDETAGMAICDISNKVNLM